MSLNNLSTNLRRYPKTCGGVGLATTCGLLLYQRARIQRLFGKLTNSDASSSESDIKRPDYIYIKYHIYRESMRKLRQKEENDKKWISVIINPIGKWWKAAKHSVAWRLLRIAQTGTHHERLKAVRQLASIDHLKDWDFRHLAQMCDARTAVSLARSGADTRWFMPVHMHGCIRNPKLVLAALHDMLNRMRPNACVDHFFNKYFPQQDPDDDLDVFFTQDKSTAMSVQDMDMLKEIIAFLHHMTKDERVAKQILADGGLLQLLELQKIFAGDNETLATLCKVLANLSLADDSVEHFYASGWLSVLAEWQHCIDLRLQVIAAKTLANLDHDDPNHCVYPPNVYPLHPRQRTRCAPKADIVFIHGLLGGVFITWRQKDRKPTELGLYGRNAFYTSETDDVFLVGESSRMQQAKKKLKKQQQMEKADKEQTSDQLLKTTQKTEEQPLTMSDAATKELVETLRQEAELEPEWEVVHPDVPLKANENCAGTFSVSGPEWLNQDSDKNYTNCWPMEWLPDDYPNSRILGIDYTSAVTEWSANFTKYCPCEKGQGQIEVRANSLLERIAKSDVGGNQRPVVWIGHSMGGILTKIMLMRSVTSTDPQVQQVARNTSGIVFLGTPHRGSPIAKWKQHMQLILSPSIEVKEMEENAPKLLELHESFMKCLHTCFRHIKVVSIAEGTPTMLTTFKFPLRIVTEESARINYGDFYVLKDDHLSLSKPIFRQSFLYQRLLTLIDEAVQVPVHMADQSKLPSTQLQAQQALQQQQQRSTKTPNPNPAGQAKSIFSLFPHITFKYSTPQSTIDA